MVLSAVVDLSHYSQVRNFPSAKSEGILRKATQGLLNVAPDYGVQNTGDLNSGLLWGACHFGTGSDGVTQTEHILKAIQTACDTLLKLNFEPNPQELSMSLGEARAFVPHVSQEKRHYLGFYSGLYVRPSLDDTTTHPYLNGTLTCNSAIACAWNISGINPSLLVGAKVFS